MNRFLELIQGILAPTTVGDGRQVVTTAGTRAQLEDKDCAYVIVTAEDNNTGAVVIGGSTVVAAQATRQGILLEPSRSEKIYVSNLNRLYIDAEQDGDGCIYMWFRR